MISRFSTGFAALVAGMLGGLGAGAASEVSGEHWTASAELPPTYGVDQAVDGAASTHWAAPNRPPIWIQARFDAPRWISRVRILQVPNLRLYSNCRRVALSLSDGNCYSCALLCRTIRGRSHPRRPAL